MQTNYAALARQIEDSNTFSLLWHINPDADCVGSSMALKIIMEQFGKKAIIYSDSEVREHLTFLNAVYEVYDSDKNYPHADMAIALDCGSFERTGKAGVLFKNSRVTANLDHHGTNPLFADINIVNPEAVATAEIVYCLIEALGAKLTKEVAGYLFAAIFSDSRGFRTSSVSANTFDVCSKLLSTGIDSHAISTNLFSQTSELVMRIKSRALSEMEMFINGQLAVAVIPDTVLEKHGLVEHPAYGNTANELAGVKGVKIGALLKQHGGVVWVELRSSGSTDVSSIAIRLGGGGHMNAAGFTFNGTIEQAKDAVIENARGILLT